MGFSGQPATLTAPDYIFFTILILAITRILRIQSDWISDISLILVRVMEPHLLSEKWGGVKRRPTLFKCLLPRSLFL